jgi:hypothetical protein
VKEGGRLFGKEAAERIADAVRWQESFPQSRKPHRGTPAAPGAQVLVARVTSGTPDANGLYAAVITQRQPGGSYTDFGAVKVAPLNGETLTSGMRYPVMAADPAYTGAPAYLVLDGASPGTVFSGGNFLADSQSIPTSPGLASTTQITSWNNASTAYDTDNYFNGGTTFKVPITGYYRITLCVQWAANTTGSRQIFITSVGASDLPGGDGRPAMPTSVTWAQSLSLTSNAAAGNTFHCEVCQDSGGNLAAVASLCIERIG